MRMNLLHSDEAYLMAVLNHAMLRDCEVKLKKSGGMLDILITNQQVWGKGFFPHTEMCCCDCCSYNTACFPKTEMCGCDEYCNPYIYGPTSLYEFASLKNDCRIQAYSENKRLNNPYEPPVLYFDAFRSESHDPSIPVSFIF